MILIEYLMLGCILGAVMALTPGLINLAVAERTIRRGYRAGVQVTLGAGVMEFIYTFLALYFIDVIIQNRSIGLFLKVGAVFLFFGLSIFYLLRKAEPINQPRSKPTTRDFVMGMGVTAMNLLIVPTWIFLGLWLRSYGLPFEEMKDMVFLSLGSALGACIVFLGYVKLGNYIVNKLEKVTAYTNKFLGIVFLAIATIQTVRLIYFD